MIRSTRRWLAALALVVLLMMVLGTRLSTAAAAWLTDEKDAAVNQLTDEEKKAGWKLLFDGKSFDGWHNFKKRRRAARLAGQGRRPGLRGPDQGGRPGDGRQVRLVRAVDRLQHFRRRQQRHHVPRHQRRRRNLGDRAGNPARRQREGERSAIRCGWLYQLYKPEIDPKTNKPLDATKPVGEWNHIRIVIAPPPAKSADRRERREVLRLRLQQRRFQGAHRQEQVPRACRISPSSTAASSALQGDHGSISFRNIKLRPIAANNTP